VRTLALPSMVVVLGLSAKAHAQQSGSDVARADTLFHEAKQLVDAGRYAEACPKFSESVRLASGIGVTLHLADCYERTGRTASAWTEFREAERLAREKSDTRADLAHTRVRALEPKLRRLTIEVAPAAAPASSEMRMDGELLPREQWNVALAVDPVDHLITLRAPGRAERTLTAHVQADSPSLTVRFDDSVDPGAAPVAILPAVVIPTPVVTTPSLATPLALVPPKTRRTRQWIELGLVGGAVVSAGVGAAFLVAKNDSMTNGGLNGGPEVNTGLAIASRIGFAVGGAALASAVVLYLTTPTPKESALIVTPTPLVGGAGAFVGGRF
jgi:hypothetical protein